jgi:hypothetical protein
VSPDRERLIFARGASILVQYVAVRGRGGDRVSAGVVDVDMGVRRLPSMARGDNRSFFLPLPCVCVSWSLG